MIQRTLLEWERIGFGASDDTIPEPIAARVSAAANRSMFAGRGGDGVLEFGRQSLRARGVVGVISAQGCQFEILPKIEGAGESVNTNETTLRHRLIHMLGVALDIRIDAGAMSRLGTQRETLLEILIRLFCGKLTTALRQGMPRRYVTHQEDIPALRGSLDVTRQFSTLAAQPQKLACRFDALSPDFALNQVMKAAVSHLSRLSQAPDNQRALHDLTFAYADITAKPRSTLPWDQITLDRTNEQWRELLSLARLLLGDQHQKTSAGSNDGHALLFEMNVLFEEYIARTLKRALAGFGLRVTSQGGRRDCLFEDSKGRFQTRPDILVRQGDEIVLVIDTKWKRMAARIDDPKQGVSQADVYQLMAYSQLYDSRKVMLLYPHHYGLHDAPVFQSYAIAKDNSPNRLFVATVDVAASRHSVEAALGKMMQSLQHIATPFNAGLSST